MKRHRCFIPDASTGYVALPDTEAHHVRHVLRLTEGAELLVFNGRGDQWRARIHTLDRRQITVDLLDPIPAVAEPPVAVTLALGLLKGDQMSSVVRDATALGVSRIVPFASSHVAVPSAARLVPERLARIAASSAAQCGRAVVPIVEDVRSFDDLIGDAAAGLRIMCVEPAHGAPEVLVPVGPDRPGVATLFVGPEGGWADVEVARGRAAGAMSLSLGPRTLRAEIAPTVALTALWTRWGWQ